MFKGKVVKGVRNLLKRNNLHTSAKITKEECEKYSKHLESIGFGYIETKKMNNKVHSIYKKKIA